MHVRTRDDDISGCTNEFEPMTRTNPESRKTGFRSNTWPITRSVCEGRRARHSHDSGDLLQSPFSRRNVDVACAAHVQRTPRTHSVPRRHRHLEPLLGQLVANVLEPLILGERDRAAVAFALRLCAAKPPGRTAGRGGESTGRSRGESGLHCDRRPMQPRAWRRLVRQQRDLRPARIPGRRRSGREPWSFCSPISISRRPTTSRSVRTTMRCPTSGSTSPRRTGDWPPEWVARDPDELPGVTTKRGS